MSRCFTLAALLFCVLSGKRPVVGGAVDGTEEGGLLSVLAPVALSGKASTQCQQDLRTYHFCDLATGLSLLCSNEKVLKAPIVQSKLNCTGNDAAARIADCHAKCLTYGGALIGEQVRPCPVSISSMHSFSAKVSFAALSSPSINNLSSIMIFPLPNMKSASGLSLTDFGAPAKCVQIPSSAYCVITATVRAGMQAVNFNLGYCLPGTCSETELRDWMGQILGTAGISLNGFLLQCGLVRPIAKAEGTGRQMQTMLGWEGIPVEYPRTRVLGPGTWIAIILIVLILLLVAVGTATDWHRESRERRLRSTNSALGDREPDVPGMEAAQPLAREVPQLPVRGVLEGFVHHWSLLRNARSFLRLRDGKENPFAAIDSLRTISMVQVILGHMYVFVMGTCGIANMEQFSPPHGKLGSLSFQLIPGGFYAVDSFFLMSGFLCAYSLNQKVFTKPGNRTALGFAVLYPKFLLFRYLRLLPTEMFCILFAYYIVPCIGTGVLWNLKRAHAGACSDSTGVSGCPTYWWTNVLFVQNFIPSMTSKNTGPCFGHTWYLANDFQLYLTAPFFCFAYAHDRRIGWFLLAATTVVSVVLPMATVATYGYVPDTLLGGNHLFEDDYIKPWCRAAPFVTGIGMAWLWMECLVKFKGRHTSMQGGLGSFSASMVGLVICGFTIFGRMAFYQCSIIECIEPNANPVPRSLQYLWAGFARLGWSIGLGTILILCFQSRFLPLVQNILNRSFWQPFAKLSYSAYLIHTSVLIICYCTQEGPVQFTTTRFTYFFVSFVVITLLAALAIFLCVEKPLANLQMKVLGGAGGD